MRICLKSPVFLVLVNEKVSQISHAFLHPKDYNEPYNFFCTDQFLMCLIHALKPIFFFVLRIYVAEENGNTARCTTGNSVSHQ
jgi:hypothetical protein